MTNTAVIYCRVSKDEQATNYSLGEQERLCLEYAQRHRFPVAEIYREDFSGAKPDRPEMDRLLDRARDGKYQHMIVADVDRFARTAFAQFILEEELRRYGVQIHYVLNHFEDTPEGNLQKSILVSFAEFERAKIASRMQRGIEARLRSGKPVTGGGNGTYGYDYHDDELHINEFEASVVRLIYTWYVDEKLGTPAIARRLTEQGILTKTGKTKWSDNSVLQILKNAMYRGVHRYKQYEVPVPPIVAENVWYAAQEQRKKNRNKPKANAVSFYELSGHLVCTECGYRSQGWRTVGRKDRKTKTVYRYYRCPYNRHDKPIRMVNAKIIEPLVWSAICEFFSDLDKAAELILAEYESTDDHSRTQERIALLDTELQSIQQRRMKLLKLYEKTDNLAQDALLRMLNDLENQERIFGEELEQLRQEKPPITKDNVAALLESVKDELRELPHFTPENRRKFYDLFDVTVYWFKDASDIRIEGLFPPLLTTNTQLRVRWSCQ